MSNYIAACIMCKDDTECLIENINYHRKIGIDYFIIYDNMSKVPIHIRDHKIKIIRWSDDKIGSHIRAFNDCLKNHGKLFKWIAFFDTDEFIVLKKDNSIKDLLKRYEHFGGLGVQWRCFGSSGLIKKPKSVIESYVHATAITQGDNKHIKTIVQPRYTIGARSPHHFTYEPGKYCVNENNKYIKGPFNTPYTYKFIQMNHYVTRSREDFELKRKRGGGNARTSSKLTEAFWERFQGTENETSILDFLKRIGE